MAHRVKLSENPALIDHPIIDLEAPFADERGSIVPLVDEDMKSAVMIHSKKGAVRANHFHKTDWHYCYVLAGSIDYYWRPKGSSEKPKHVLIRKGQMFFTPPLVEHTMCFPEDGTFLCLGKNPRDQKSYEADIERVNLI